MRRQWICEDMHAELKENRTTASSKHCHLTHPAVSRSQYRDFSLNTATSVRTVFFLFFFFIFHTGILLYR